jgi:hypothetical protein
MAVSLLLENKWAMTSPMFHEDALRQESRGTVSTGKSLRLQVADGKWNAKDF